MGLCVSSHKNASQDSDAAVKMRLSSFVFRKHSSKLLNIPPTPVKENNSKPTIADVALKPDWSPHRSVSSFRDFGSKDDMFFDSRPWLDSDCEDDFYSVNGDFSSRTSSQGSTPVHPIFSKSRSPTPEPAPPIEKKKKLADLFKESIRDRAESDDQNAKAKHDMANENGTVLPPPKSTQCTPYISGSNSTCNSERSVNGESITIRDKPVCCLPVSAFVLCRSLSERKKMSPTVAVNQTSVA